MIVGPQTSNSRNRWGAWIASRSGSRCEIAPGYLSAALLSSVVEVVANNRLLLQCGADAGTGRYECDALAAAGSSCRSRAGLANIVKFVVKSA